MASAAKGACLNHVSRESTDVKRLAQFYIEIFGFEQVESPQTPDFDVIWLKLGDSCIMHLIGKDPDSNLPESPWSVTSPLKDPIHLRRGHHLCFTLTNFDDFVHTLKDKGIKVHEQTHPSGKFRQVFFFDPDGNGLEASS